METSTSSVTWIENRIVNDGANGGGMVRNGGAMDIVGMVSVFGMPMGKLGGVVGLQLVRRGDEMSWVTRALV